MTQARQTGWRQLASGHCTDNLSTASQPGCAGDPAEGTWPGARGARRQRVPAAVAESSQR